MMRFLHMQIKCNIFSKKNSEKIFDRLGLVNMTLEQSMRYHNNLELSRSATIIIDIPKKIGYISSCVDMF